MISPARMKRWADYAPLVILFVYAFILIGKVIFTDVGLQWRHYPGLLLIIINLLIFTRKHKLGVLITGLVLILGLIGLLSLTTPVHISTLFIGPDSQSRIPLFYGQPVFLLWLALHFTISWRYYMGIGKSRYWRNLDEYDESIIWSEEDEH